MVDIAIDKARRGKSAGHRLLDLAVTVALLPGAAALMVPIAASVFLVLGRPIIFRQRRAGRGGGAFTLVKFRTMHDYRSKDGTPLPDDDRTPWFGALLRRTRLDELPELWNILRGDMSLIGPRPLLPETVAAMGDAGRRRGRVRPGLTGWAQTSGNSILTNADKLALDLWYVDHRGFGLDLLIVARTVALVVLGDRISERRVRHAQASMSDRAVGDHQA